MTEDILTQQHAHIIARDYNVAPYTELKTERTLNPGTDLQSLWLAKKDGTVRSFAQYHADHLIGDLCADCWGDGKIFGERDTPKVVTAQFGAITACPGFEPAPNGCFTQFIDGEVFMSPLVQDPADPSLFTLEIPNWVGGETLIVSWEASAAGESILRAYLDPSGSEYFLQTQPICHVCFKNSYLVCNEPAVVGFGGAGIIIF